MACKGLIKSVTFLHYFLIKVTVNQIICGFSSIHIFVALISCDVLQPFHGLTQRMDIEIIFLNSSLLPQSNRNLVIMHGVGQSRMAK